MEPVNNFNCKKINGFDNYGPSVKGMNDKDSEIKVESKVFKSSRMINEDFNAEVNVLPEEIVTDKMLQEEKMLEEKTAQEEKELKAKMLNEEKRKLEEQCYKRLHLLLSRSSIYAKFMAEKLQIEEKKIMQGKKTVSQKNDFSSNSTLKRKMGFDEHDMLNPPKKFKTAIKVVDVFKKENMESIQFLETKQQHNPSSNDKDICEQQPELFYGGVMRSYQIEGYEWLKVLFENGVNGILADEMGLGKTIQCIAFIAHLIEMGIPGPFFICGPLSTVPNWYAEFQRFTPDIPVIVYHGDKNERIALRQKFNKKVQVKGFSCFPVVLTSYQVALIDGGKLESTEWKLLVIDEAHRIKNYQCKLVAALKKYNAVHRLLLTGTPLQNNLAELWSLLNFVLPEIFDDLNVFESWFDIARLSEKGAAEEIAAREQEKHIISTIHQILTPFLLRRTKADVELGLPLKKEVIVHAPLTDLQRNYYMSVIDNTIQKLFYEPEPQEVLTDVSNSNRKKRNVKTVNYRELNDKDYFSTALETVPATTPTYCVSKMDQVFSDIHLNLRNLSMCLRKICDHPYLISYPLDPVTLDYKVDEDLIKSCGKLLILDMMLPELRKRGHKVLIFSQFVTMLEILEDYCSFRNYPFNCLYGSMSLSERQENIKEFRESESSFVFLLSTKAGGLGINLSEADTVILYDSDWNPQGDLQAQDRCHRIGQTKPVVVYRLLVPNTVDEKIFDRATAKRKLEKVIIQKGRFSSKDSLVKLQQTISKEELMELLETRDIDGLVKTDDCVLSPDELKKLLDRSDMVQKN